MFGYKITIFKKNKGVKVDPVKTEPKVDSEYEAWKKEQEKKKRDEIYAKNKELKFNLIKQRVESLVKSFKNKNPQPFLVGEEVIYNFYGGHNHFKLEWFGSPGQLYSTFKIEELNGPFKLPVHKIFVNSQWLYDKLCFGVDISWDEEETEHSINSKINNYLHKLSSHKQLFEWAIDFDWQTLKFPYEGSHNEEGYLDLKWGGFNANYFLSASTPLAKRQRKLWKKDKQYRKMKEEMDAELKKLHDEIENDKNNLY